MFKSWRRKDGQEFLSDRKFLVPIVSDAAIAIGTVGDGRLIPVVVLDTTNRPDLVDLFKAHDQMPPGDAHSTWIWMEEFKDHLGLWLQFQRPFQTEAILNFDLSERGLTVDLAIRGRAIYLQAGKPGDRFYRTMQMPRILVELGAKMAPDRWEGLWKTAVANRVRKEGLRRRQAREFAPRYIERLRSEMEEYRRNPGVYIVSDEDENHK